MKTNYKGNRRPGDWQTITLECERRPRAVTDLLEDYDRAANRNERQYYLCGERLSLKESLKVHEHSPSGFFHGYLGSGPSQLALAVCLKLYPLQVAKAVYHSFKEEYIAAIPKEKENFAVSFEVPVDPLAYWNMKPVLDWVHDVEEPELTEQEAQENERIKAENERLQQEHDRAYEQAIQLPNSIRYEFKELHHFASFCYLRIVNNYQSKVLVIATDPGDRCQNSGSSITNAAEQIATQVCQEFAIPFEKLDWIERYVRACSIYQYKQQQRWDFKETWDRVIFAERNGRLTNPDWEPLDQREVEHLKNLLIRN